MKPDFRVRHEFVDLIPQTLEERVVYVSIKYATAVHNCACGCGHRVVTPLTPADWELAFDGETISLDPSIGNWSFPCRSHYWIRRNQVEWSYYMSKEQVEANRQRARKKSAGSRAEADEPNNAKAMHPARQSHRWRRLFRWRN